MDNQHRLIPGYRELTGEEVALIQSIKQMEACCLALLDKMEERDSFNGHPESTDEESIRAKNAQCHRWFSIARTDLETGFMAMVRGVAKPQPLEMGE